jgi:hypothetical protein
MVLTQQLTLEGEHRSPSPSASATASPQRANPAALTLAASVSLNHQLGRPSRALVDYCA